MAIFNLTNPYMESTTILSDTSMSDIDIACEWLKQHIQAKGIRYASLHWVCVVVRETFFRNYIYPSRNPFTNGRQHVTLEKLPKPFLSNGALYRLKKWFVQLAR